MTVNDIEKAVAFYTKYFDFTVDFIGQFPNGFFDENATLYQLEKGAGAKIAMITSRDSFTMELFQFFDQTPAKPTVWNMPGYHHICLKVANFNAKYKEMLDDGLEFFFPPDYKGDPANNAYWTFLKDPDGNMMELQ